MRQTKQPTISEALLDIFDTIELCMDYKAYYEPTTEFINQCMFKHYNEYYSYLLERFLGEGYVPFEHRYNYTKPDKGGILGVH